MWQAMLMSAGLPATKKVFYHGFITSGGQKMSKSIGNVIDPLAIVDEFGVDALRYFLASHVHPFEDSDVTMERFKETYNADLANGLGNLVARIMKLAEDNLDVPATPEPGGFPDALSTAVNSYEFNEAMEVVWHHIRILDHRIAETQPFKLVKKFPDDGKELIEELVGRLYLIAEEIEAFMPETSEKIKAAILANQKPGNLFPRKD